MKEIQLFKPVFNKEEILKQISECLDKGWTGLGYKTTEFEEKFKSYTRVPYAHFLNSATSGLHLSLEMLHTGGHIVCTTPLTFISDSHVISFARLTPQFVDIDDTLCMDPDLLNEFLDINHKKVAAVIYVGIGGNTGRLADIINVCWEYKTPLIFDASHCMGTYYNGIHIGREGQDFTVFSFQAVKNLPTADSGMICCKNESDDKRVRKLSWLGISKDTYSRQTQGGNWQYNVESLGWKYHGNSIMAAMGIAGLEIFEYQNFLRRQQAIYYAINLNFNRFRFIPVSNGCLSSRHLFQVRVPSFHRDAIINYAREKGIQLGVHYLSHTFYNMYSYWKGLFPNAEKASGELISLPIGPHLTHEDINYIIEVLNAYPF